MWNLFKSADGSVCIERPAPTIILDSRQNIRLHSGARANVVLLTHLWKTWCIDISFVKIHFFSSSTWYVYVGWNEWSSVLDQPKSGSERDNRLPSNIQFDFFRRFQTQRSETRDNSSEQIPNQQCYHTVTGQIYIRNRKPRWAQSEDVPHKSPDTSSPEAEKKTSGTRRLEEGSRRPREGTCKHQFGSVERTE